jgi:hypothetical protein
VQGVLSPFPDWKGRVHPDHSQQAWLEKIPSSLGTAGHIGQPEERKSVIFGAPSDGTEEARFSTNYHRQSVHGSSSIITVITEIFTGVDQAGLRSVSESWVNRRKWMTKHEGKHYTR